MGNASAGAGGTLKSLSWPLLPGETDRPEWTGRGFRVGPRVLPVLTGSVGSAGWNDDLADMLELEVSADRPIGVASRSHALRALEKYGAARPGGVIMDVGCANGYMIEAIRASHPETEVVGCDYAVPPLEKLAGRIPDVPLLQLDLVRSELPDAFCDGIVLLNVLEHIEDDMTALKQIHRMLRTGGVFVIEVPAGPSLYDPFDRLVGHFRRYLMRDLVWKVEGAGFEVVDKSHLGFFAYPMFWLLKKRNQQLSHGSEQKQREVVLATMRKGRSGKLQQAVFKIEDAARPFVPMPIGMRCLITARAR